MVRVREARRHAGRGLMVAPVVVVALVVSSVAAAATPRAVDAARQAASPKASGGIGQIYLTGLTKGDAVTLSTAAGKSVASGKVDRLGSLVFRGLHQGATYKAKDTTSGWSAKVKVLVAGDNPPTSFYAATSMKDGINYIPMRDGITLAATVRPPVGKSLADGPFPTVIEYSGYGVAAPDDALANVLGKAAGKPNDPLAPTPETYVGAVVMRLAGYTVVSVQLRGTGCSGGEADLFDLPTVYDGYDAVETVAAQPWVLGGKVGMIGISFSAFSQISTAGTRPPHLAAIAPMSFLGRLWDVGRPGGIVNDGFAEGWLKEREQTARPAPAKGALEYANVLVKTDAQCRANQDLRLQTRDAVKIVRGEPTLVADYRHRDFTKWMGRIQVPVFGSLQYQDEQTSAYAMLAAKKLLGANDKVWLTFSSGVHDDSLDIENFANELAFLDIYVAGQSPQAHSLLSLAAPQIWGDDHAPLPPTPYQGEALATAKAQFEARPRVTVRFERPNSSEPGGVPTRWGLTSSTWPPAGATVSTMFLGKGGTLTSSAGASGQASYLSDPKARPRTSEKSWTEVPAGDGVGFISASLTADMVTAGPAAADLWLKSTASDTDLQVTVTEVRPDGSEMLVNTGVQRASVRAVDSADSTPTVPDITFAKAQPLAKGFNEVHVQVLPFGHAFRVGSRIRIVIAPVGGDRSAWAYASIDSKKPPTNTIAFGTSKPSSVSFTVLPGVTAGAPLPPCDLSGQPCRPYHPARNGG